MYSITNERCHCGRATHGMRERIVGDDVLHATERFGGCLHIGRTLDQLADAVNAYAAERG